MRKTLPVSLVLPVVFLALWGCSDSPPVEKIRQHVDAITESIETKDASGVMDHLGEDFLANRQMSKQETYRLLVATFLQHNKIGVTLTAVQLTPVPQRPELYDFQASALVTGADRLIPNDGRVSQLSGQWQLQDDEWKLTVLNWE